MNPSLQRFFVFILLFLCIGKSYTVKAGQTEVPETRPANQDETQKAKVIVVLDITSIDTKLSESNMLFLTESVYSAATSFSPDRFSVVSREKLQRVLSGFNEKNQDAFFADGIGTVLGANIVLSCTVTESNGSFSATVKGFGVGNGQLLGLEHANAVDVEQLARELRSSTRKLLARYSGIEVEKELDGSDEVSESPRDEMDDFLVQIEVEPENATIEMDERTICEKTPCSYRVENGVHQFVVEAPLYQPENKKVAVQSDRRLRFHLVPRKYNYFGMHDTSTAGWLVSAGLSPLEREYKNISVIDGVLFAKLHPIVDIGFGGGIFGYRSSERGNSWSILGFGPAVRTGRLIIASQLQLLSFRHKSDIAKEGWLPGISVRGYIPLLNQREAKGWASLVPTPTVGLDVWFSELEHDQTQFWLGFSWPSKIGF